MGGFFLFVCFVLVSFNLVVCCLFFDARGKREGGGVGELKVLHVAHWIFYSPGIYFVDKLEKHTIRFRNNVFFESEAWR